MKKLFIILSFLSCGASYAQQSPQYSQYSFNNFGYNPAFAGTTKCIDIKAGTRLQWVGFEGAPRTTFASLHLALARKKHYANKGKHAIGLYIEQDQVHLTSRTYIKGAYAYHKRLTRKLTMGLGIFAGIQQYNIDDVFGRQNNVDPVLANAAGSVLRYPDIMPGILLYNDQFYFSFSVNQFYFKDINLGQEAQQINQYYLGAGHKSRYGSWTVFKSALLKQNVLGPPSLDLNVAWVYEQNLTFGIGYRVGEAIIAQLKMKLFKSITVTYAFDFPLNGIFGNYSHEVMLGFSQCGGEGVGQGSAIQQHTCPAYDW